MAKEYFQDITPPHTTPVPPPQIKKMEPEEVEPEQLDPRSIRNIAVSRSRPRIDESPRPPQMETTSEKPVIGKVILWAILGALITSVGILGVFFFRPTTVTVIPRSHTVTFSEGTLITATAEAGTGLQYTTSVHDYEESTTVPAGAVKKVEEKATGSLTISNSFATTPVPLLKNTRFETTKGLVYRITDAVTIPGKKGTVPGTLTVKVVADQAGEQYNSGPDTFTLPGLKTNADMFAGITARSATAFTGGFVGDKPTVDETILSSARTDLRSRLAEKAHATSSENGLTFPELATISYESKLGVVNGTSTLITEIAHVSQPVFSTNAFASSLGAAVSADTEGSVIVFIPNTDFTVRRETESDTSPTLSLAITGSGRFVWTVDPQSIATTLAGKNKASFEEIMRGIKSVQEAHHRVQPFWSSTFPSDPARIIVTVSDPLAR